MDKSFQRIKWCRLSRVKYSPLTKIVLSIKLTNNYKIYILAYDFFQKDNKCVLKTRNTCCVQGIHLYFQNKSDDYLYLCWQVENTKWILCSVKWCILKISDVQGLFSFLSLLYFFLQYLSLFQDDILSRKGGNFPRLRMR